MDPEKMSPEQLEAARKSAKIKRRLGYLIAAVLTLSLSGPMMWGAYQGAKSGQVYDPFTNELMSTGSQSENPCLSDANELLRKAANLEKLDPVWDDRTTAWIQRCRKDHSDAFLMLQETRADLRNKSKKQ